MILGTVARSLRRLIGGDSPITIGQDHLRGSRKACPTLRREGNPRGRKVINSGDNRVDLADDLDCTGDVGWTAIQDRIPGGYGIMPGKMIIPCDRSARDMNGGS